MNRRTLSELGLEDWYKWSKAVTASYGQAARKPPSAQAMPVEPNLRSSSAEALVPADNLVALELQVKSCTRCRLCERRTNPAFDRGMRKVNQVFVVGEGPGAQEDIQGKPFVGQAGQLLDMMLTSVGLSAEVNVNITNIVKCRPPDNRNPERVEIETCIAYLRKQIELLSPKLIIATGKIAAGTLLSSAQSMGDMRGSVHSFEGISLIATYHPAYLLRSPKQKAKAWDDMLFIKRTLEGILG